MLGLLPAEPGWDVPDRLVAAVEYLLLGDEAEDYRSAGDPWAAFRAIVAEREEFVALFVRTQPVQTNEPQRCWALLPLFLAVAERAGRPLDLLELGTSAGLNLFWDRYRYVYATGSWGPASAGLLLSGDERAAIPGTLLSAGAEIRRRRGIDLNPLDVTSAEDLRRLLCFRPPGPARERILRAAAVAGGGPPELIRGDYLELLPGLLSGRSDDSLTVVFQTISTIYLPLRDRLRIRTMIDAAAVEGPLAWISTPTPEEHGLRGAEYPLELAIWPGGERRLVAQMANGGEWLEWWG